ncbi:hypothetical protein ACFYKX_25535 [Cytobacillus sp. FJAT-54145]|uniref:Uncharacterized protein n=1 Tax=Cytobacillus spartinae TaxID=3299023 RepID=A0ABW6KIC0_9BACI
MEFYCADLINSYTFRCSYSYNYTSYSAVFLRPLFKGDDTWYLIPDGEETLSDEHYKELKDHAMYYINSEFHRKQPRIIIREGIIQVDEAEWSPMFRRINYELDIFEEYMVSFCLLYLTKEISTEVPCCIKFDKKIASVVFEIPYLAFAPSIHINAILYNWDKADIFVKDTINSLKNLLPSKNKNLFK